jgi:hypothetical protein
MVVYQPFILAVDRDGRSAATRIERHGHPGRLLDDHVLQLWSINIGGLYPLDDFGAREPRADRLAHHRPATVAADQIIRGNGDFIATVEVAPMGHYAILALVEALDLHAI